ncbi:hypothetical protein K2173_017487 [Erythroxylum novogranatense]|uniref:Protein TIFY n=1 Tax=Erythroxylum novogranatense TaxID=1862640 RepID=A0AAV8TL39_9ROSI|nr:hypothetical protein K2173_017487 [Erythroxylum novogranatense]
MEPEAEGLKPEVVVEEKVQDGEGISGSCKEIPDLLEKKGSDVMNNGPRSATMATIEQDATFPAQGQLTISYGGTVVVFDDIPAEKVREILVIAKAAAAVKKTQSASPLITPVLTRSTSMRSTASGLASPQAQLYPVHKGSLCNLQADLPIARRHSLQRFFEKRRDRLGSKSPYTPSPTAKTYETTEPDFSAETSTDAACLEERPAPAKEQQKVAANLA